MSCEIQNINVCFPLSNFIFIFIYLFIYLFIYFYFFFFLAEILDNNVSYSISLPIVYDSP